MPVLENPRAETNLLKNLWDLGLADGLAGKPLELLQYRSNLLGADLRITNFGGGNTSSKFELPQCYETSILTIDQMGGFIQEHTRRSRRPAFGGTAVNSAADREASAAAILPYLRGAVSSNHRAIAHYEDSEDALEFASSNWAEPLCAADTADLPQARRPGQARHFSSFHNYVALPRPEAFRIEYWALEDAKLRRMPPEREFSRKIFAMVGGGSGIGREVALLVARKGGHVVVADRDLASAEAVSKEAADLISREMTLACAVDLASQQSISAALRAAVLEFGGIDTIVNTAAIYPTPQAGVPAETMWTYAFDVNVTGNFLLAKEAATILKSQNLPASMVFTSSANAVVPKQGSELYDSSKAAVSHLIRELAIGLEPLVRVNGIAPATVVAGSSMFPRDRVIGSLRKYGIEFAESDSTGTLRGKLAEFYARRTITRLPILPSDCANAICWLADDESAKTTGHIIRVDGGLPEAFLR
jgi:NAD(P)-dependent dehydrogenase (short-subunit alcohol dehydrogenase family)